MPKDGQVKARNSVSKRKPKLFNETLPTDLTVSFRKDIDDVLSTFALPTDSTWSQLAAFKVEYLETNLWSKFSQPTKSGAEARRAAAITKWLAAEARNADTNHRLLFDEANFGPFSSRKVIRKARSIVSQIIGLSPDLSILDGGFSNGASTRVKRGPVAIAHKYVGEANASQSAWHLFQEHVLPGTPLWADCFDTGLSNWVETEASVMFTVPKNSDIDRVACKEPEINMYMQRGVGNFFRQQLRRKRGIDLNDQTANQKLAKLGSLKGTLATVDLSSASDLISTQLVYLLLPLDWFLLLDAIRVKQVNIDGRLHDLHMFSSMGNGFTFELESLLFYALTSAVCYLNGTRGRISVYGDDIILPVGAAGILFKVFQWFGFKVNTKKSFYKGNFRESCGRHYFAGCDVTPFFIRQPIRTLSHLMLVLNELRAWATDEDAALQYVEPRLSELWFKYSRYVPSFLFGGKDLNDPTSLGSPHKPRKRINLVRIEVEAPPMGGYLQWLHTREFSHGAYVSYPVVDSLLDNGVWTKDYASLTSVPKEGLCTSVGKLEIAVKISRNPTLERALPLCQMWWSEVFPDLTAL